MKSIYAVIMAGGGGTRLWPLSRARHPKQALKIKGDRSLFQTTVDRLLPLMPIDNIYIVTVEEQKDLLQSQVPTLSDENYILEPEPRGTASVVGLAATLLQDRDADSIMCCLPADHYIENDEGFRQLLIGAAEIAEENELVTIGIPPSYASTGYGYIHSGEPKDLVKGFQSFRVREFKEKPDKDTAAKFLRSGDYYWNSGMFIWRTDRILADFEQHMPELSSGLSKISNSLGKMEEKDILEDVWLSLQPETIDYGVMEKADSVSVLIAKDLGWFDIGSWDGLFDLLDQDELGNVLIGRELLIKNVKDSLIMKTSSNDATMIALIDIDNIILVYTDDVLLVCKRGNSEKVREIVKELTKTGKLNLL